VQEHAQLGSRFTGKERDAESGLDNFGARYFGSNMGRFISPDYSDGPDPVAFADLENPQSLNLYSYVENNPISNTDPDGHKKCADGSDADTCVTVKADPDPPLSTITSNLAGNILYHTIDGASQFVHQFTNIMHTPGGPGCMAGMIANGSMVGSGSAAVPGLVGLAGGPSVVVTEPTALIIGGVGGGLTGGGLAMTACPGGAANGGRGGAGDKKVTFKHEHAGRHLEGSGLNQAKVENAIAADVQASTKGASSTGGFWGRVVVDGQTVTYRAMTLSDGSINVGTYTLPRP